MSGARRFPPELWYDRERHMWAARDTDGSVRVGIDVLGLETLGDLAYVSLCAVGAPVQRGAPIGALEAAKMTGDVLSPISGRVVERNDAAIADPRIVNADPYAAWLVRIDPSDWTGESAALVSGPAIGPWVEGELVRYREQGWIE